MVVGRVSLGESVPRVEKEGWTYPRDFRHPRKTVREWGIVLQKQDTCPFWRMWF